jgi:hypothetical protein
MLFQIEYLCRGFDMKDRHAPVNRRTKYIQRAEQRGERPILLPTSTHTAFRSMDMVVISEKFCRALGNFKIKAKCRQAYATLKQEIVGLT